MNLGAPHTWGMDSPMAPGGETTEEQPLLGSYAQQTRSQAGLWVCKAPQWGGSRQRSEGSRGVCSGRTSGERCPKRIITTFVQASVIGRGYARLGQRVKAVVKGELRRGSRARSGRDSFNCHLRPAWTLAWRRAGGWKRAGRGIPLLSVLQGHLEQGNVQWVLVGYVNKRKPAAQILILIPQRACGHLLSGKHFFFVLVYGM